MVELLVKVRRAEGAIVANLASAQVGCLSFSVKDRRLVDAYKTFVDPAYRSMGIAQRLVQRLMEYCKERHYLLAPSCSYISSYLERYGEYADLLEGYDASAELVRQIEALGSVQGRIAVMRYFKTAKGEYGYGDVFAGVVIPQLRQIMRVAQPLTSATIESLLVHQIHEVRWLGFAALASWMKRSESPESRAYIYQTYLRHREYCNNWDLVDVSAPDIIAGYWSQRDAHERRQALLALAREEHLWTQRIAIMGTFGLIRRGMPEDTLHISEALLTHPHDLIHKAMGWMLREVGKQIDESLLTDFLDRYAHRMPRTALRYALERLSAEQRAHYMTKRQ